MVGNGLHHHGPCRYDYAGRPAPYIKDGLLGVWAMHPATTHHRRLPTQGAQDGERHPHSARLRRWAR